MSMSTALVEYYYDVKKESCNIVNFLINFNFFTATYISKTRLKVPLNPNQAINYDTVVYDDHVCVFYGTLSHCGM